jgi:hypothetical protein
MYVAQLQCLCIFNNPWKKHQFPPGPYGGVAWKQKCSLKQWILCKWGNECANGQLYHFHPLHPTNICAKFRVKTHYRWVLEVLRRRRRRRNIMSENNSLPRQPNNPEYQKMKVSAFRKSNSLLLMWSQLMNTERNYPSTFIFDLYCLCTTNAFRTCVGPAMLRLRPIPICICICIITFIIKLKNLCNRK